MKFELTVALKYLIPRWRQLSVSIISLISILVISLVVWLVVLFLSVTEGIEKKWVEQLVTLNAPVRMAPTEAYYQSYYYQIDRLSYDSNYATKTLGEKLMVQSSDPYDPTFDIELPGDFPLPDRTESGELRDPIKGGFEAIEAISATPARAQEYEMTFGNLQLKVVEGDHQNVLNQVTYVASHDSKNEKMAGLIVAPSDLDYTHLLHNLPEEKGSVAAFFANLNLRKVATTDEGYILHPSLHPDAGEISAVAIVKNGQVVRALVPDSVKSLPALQKRLELFGFQTQPLSIDFADAPPTYPLVLDSTIVFDAEVIDPDVDNVNFLQFHIKGNIQDLPISGVTFIDKLNLKDVEVVESELTPLWVHQRNGQTIIPAGQSIGEGVLVANHFQKNGVKLGDRGHISYFTSGGSTQEQRLPIYVAGFYNPGMLPIGNKLLFVNPDIVALLRSDVTISDNMLGNGLNIWLKDVSQADSVKAQLVQTLEDKGLARYWRVESFTDYEFARPILQQLKSDKNLFTLIAIIILIVACSNIISMLILLVNDKKKEIGILQALGASPRRIATIFGFCGVVCGLISSVIGTFAAILTLRHLQSLVDLLSFLQGHEAFQAAFYGSQLPNEVSYSALGFVVVATLLISLIAGIVPAMKAAKIRPTEILRAE